MKPTSLILSDLLKAHSGFLLHHDVSLSSLFLRTKRTKFVAMLSRYWDLYLSTWNVLLHGNPARDIYGGINVAASGELGVGVGEEERGSGEREVLEGLVGRVEGLVDLVVSKFGEEQDSRFESESGIPWLGSGREPRVEDGAIFLGTGALSRNSLRNVTRWMEDIYTWGEHAYGVIDSPTSTRVKRRRSPTARKPSSPPPPTQQPTTSDAHPETSKPKSPTPKDTAESNPKTDAEDGKIDKMVSYLKLGYGSYWSIPGVPAGSKEASGTATPQDDDTTRKTVSPPPNTSKQRHSRNPSNTLTEEPGGTFLIGLKGEIEEGNQDKSDDDSSSNGSSPDTNSRTVLRTLHVELCENDTPGAQAAQLNSAVSQSAMPGQNSQPINVEGLSGAQGNRTEKLRVVVYVNRPFILVFLFRLRTESLAWDSLYRSLHYQLAPLRKPLLSSTQYRPERPDAATSSSSASGSGIRDLIWNPEDLTVHSTIANIPDILYVGAEAEDADATWTRIDAISTHLHILNVYTATRSSQMVPSALERTQKTSRGWWVVWNRLVNRHRPNPDADADADADTDVVSDVVPGESSQIPTSTPGKEIILVRRSGDSSASALSTSPSSGFEAASKLAQGIGVDTRRYIEDLLSIL